MVQKWTHTFDGPSWITWLLNQYRKSWSRCSPGDPRADCLKIQDWNLDISNSAKVGFFVYHRILAYDHLFSSVMSYELVGTKKSRKLHQVWELCPIRTEIRSNPSVTSISTNFPSKCDMKELSYHVVRHFNGLQISWICIIQHKISSYVIIANFSAWAMVQNVKFSSI